MPFPLTPPPSNDYGALTWPRQLQRWLDDNPAGPLTRISTFIQLPIFNQGASTWNGYSDIVVSFNFEGPNNFSLKTIVPQVTNYALCISYQVKGVVTRYLIWDAIGSNLPGTQILYTGQPIKKNFRLEIWNTSQGIASEANGYTFYTSKLGGIDYRWGNDTILVSSDIPPCTNFKDVFSGETNLPLFPNVIADWLATTNVTVDGVNGVTAWQDSINPNILNYGGQAFSINVAKGEGLNGQKVIQTENFNNAYMNCGFLSNQVVLLVQILFWQVTSNLYTSGTGGLTIQVTVDGFFTAFGAKGVEQVNDNWYLLIADSANGILYVIDPTTGRLIETISGTPIAPGTGTVTQIGSGVPPISNPNSIVSGGQPITSGGQPILAQ